MKLKTTKSHSVEVTLEEVEALLRKLVEKKSGKKVESVEVPEQCRGAALKFVLVDETEETNLDEPKA